MSDDKLTTTMKEVAALPDVVTSFRSDITEPIRWRVESDFSSKPGVDFTAGVLSLPFGSDDQSKIKSIETQLKLRSLPVSETAYDVIQKTTGTASVPLLKLSDQARIHAMTLAYAKAVELKHEIDGSEKLRGKRNATIGNDTGVAPRLKAQAWQACVTEVAQTFGTQSCDSFIAGVRSVNSDWSERLRALVKLMKGAYDGSLSEMGSTDPLKLSDGSVIPSGMRYTAYGASVLKDFLDGNRMPRDVKAAKEQNDEDRLKDGKADPDSLTESDLSTDDIADDFRFPKPHEIGESNASDPCFHELIVDDSLPLTVDIQGYLHRTRRATQYGRSLGNPGRILTDPERRIFKRKVKVKGGIVIVDSSGSMGMTDDDLNSIVESAPAAVVLAYSYRGDGPNAWILADRGKRVKSVAGIGGSGNGVDGPALLWGVRRRKANEPIVWISDGQVTGQFDGYDTTLAIMCAKIVKKHRIIMIPDVPTAVDMFKSGKLVHKPVGPIRNALLGKTNLR